MTNESAYDLRFQSFGRWYVLGKGPHTGHGQFWVCQCACTNNTTALHEDALVEGHTQSCGCVERDKAGRLRQSGFNLIGQQFGDRLVVHKAEGTIQWKDYWRCRCRCGTVASVIGSELRRGKSKRCVKCNGKRYTSVTSGRRYAWWCVLRRSAHQSKQAWWACQCDLCGAIQEIEGRKLIKEKPPRCRKCMLRGNIPMLHRTFDRWTVIARAPTDKGGHPAFLCQCSCARHTIRSVRVSTLLNGESRSCGCLPSGKTALKEQRKVPTKAAQAAQAIKDYLFLKQQLQFLGLSHDWLVPPDDDALDVAALIAKTH